MKKLAGQDVSQKISEKMFQFDKLPNECLACLAPYDKNNKEMAMTWNVVIRDRDTVRLYCPDCWNKATTAVETFKKEKNNESPTD